MKIEKYVNFITFIFGLIILFLNISMKSLKVFKTETEFEKNQEGYHLSARSSIEMENYKKHSKANNKNKIKVKDKTTSNEASRMKNDTWGGAAYRVMNNSFVVQDIETFKKIHRKWDWGLTDRRLEDIYNDMRLNTEDTVTPRGVRAFFELFVSHFEECDKDKFNTLTIAEFQSCMISDPYLKQIIPPDFEHAPFANYTYTNITGFYVFVFNILDTDRNQLMNFYNYMLIRMITFSWKQCSVMAPFIDEVSFQCAIKISSGYKTLSSTTMRRLFRLGLELSNSENIRSLDFISFLIIATSTRLYGEINQKEDADATRNEFNSALDRNILPSRYNQDVINQMFNLVEETGKPNQGIDLLSFVFYDFFARIYEQPTLGVFKTKDYYLNQNEFSQVLNHYLFPKKILQEISNIPQNLLSVNSYQMQTYLNISNFNSEDDHFLHGFLETDDRIMYVNRNRFEGAKKNLGFRFMSKNNVRQNILSLVSNNSDLNFSITNTSLTLFKMLDYERDGYLTFEDFGNLIQISYLFTNFDTLNKGRIVAGDLYEMIPQWSDFPVVSRHLRDRAKKFLHLPQDLYVDLSMTIVMLKIEDFISTVTRRKDKTTLYEFELKDMFALINFKFVPDIFLKQCIRGTNNNIPLYDWECAFTKSMIGTLNYFESSYAYLTAKNKNISLTNTIFINIDPLLG